MTQEVISLDVPGTIVHAESHRRAGEKARHTGEGCDYGNITFTRRSGEASDAQRDSGQDLCQLSGTPAKVKTCFLCLTVSSASLCYELCAGFLVMLLKGPCINMTSEDF